MGLDGYLWVVGGTVEHLMVLKISFIFLFVYFSTTFYSGNRNVDGDDPKISERLHWKHFLISFHLPLLRFIS